MEFRKMVMTIPYARQQRDSDAKKRLLNYVGEGEGGMTWKSSVESCILPCILPIALKHIKLDEQCMFDELKKKILSVGPQSCP